MDRFPWHLGYNQPVFIVALGIVGVCLTVTRAINNGRVTVAYRMRAQGDAQEHEVAFDFYPNELREPPPPGRPVERVLVVPPTQPAANSNENVEAPPPIYSRH
ncbi:hypothetical protein CALVIDRAFT_557839 [Calocera viscosa TUFC12733]|uniref:Uncharacterized protein n=1 Tax=Calocera viscosa (strain TUFC12733) TaxID=1330018 RepID=A0A167HVN0_CALVF|nr:hypothetical protein CALVIDRAFT_557839 [Calocera viscosa TUFC12733]